MKINLWNSPYKGGWVWFSKSNLKRCSVGWVKKDRKLWFAIFGLSGSIRI